MKQVTEQAAYSMDLLHIPHLYANKCAQGRLGVLDIDQPSDECRDFRNGSWKRKALHIVGFT